MREYTDKDVEELKATIKKHLPKCEIIQKSESRFQRLLGWLLKPINYRYMTAYVSAMFGNIYLPSKAKEWSAGTTYSILRHEFIHLLDAKKWPLLMELSYLVVLPFVWTVRSHWELRAYTQTMLVEYEETGEIEQGTVTWIVHQFTSSNYGWMCPFKDRITAKVASARAQILAGHIKGLTYPHELD